MSFVVLFCGTTKEHTPNLSYLTILHPLETQLLIFKTP